MDTFLSSCLKRLKALYKQEKRVDQAQKERGFQLRFFSAIFCAFLPLFFVISYYFYGMDRLSRIDRIVSQLELKGRLFSNIYQSKKNFQARYQGADQDYLSKNIQSIEGLSRDKELLLKAAQSVTGGAAWQLEEGLKKLSSKVGKLTFTKVSEKNSTEHYEREWSLEKPALIDFFDLEKILSKIEGVNIGDFAPAEGRPQLIIQKFELSKNPMLLEKNTFLLDLGVLERGCYEKQES